MHVFFWCVLILLRCVILVPFCCMEFFFYYCSISENMHWYVIMILITIHMQSDTTVRIVYWLQNVRNMFEEKIIANILINSNKNKKHKKRPTQTFNSCVNILRNCQIHSTRVICFVFYNIISRLNAFNNMITPHGLDFRSVFFIRQCLVKSD